MFIAPDHARPKMLWWSCQLPSDIYLSTGKLTSRLNSNDCALRIVVLGLWLLSTVMHGCHALHLSCVITCSSTYAHGQLHILCLTHKVYMLISAKTLHGKSKWQENTMHLSFFTTCTMYMLLCQLYLTSFSCSHLAENQKCFTLMEKCNKKCYRCFTLRSL